MQRAGFPLQGSITLAGLAHLSLDPELSMPLQFRCPRPVSLLLVAALLMHGFAPAHAESDDDGFIAATIKAALLDNRNTSGTRINVDSRQGIVHLSGFASSEAEKAAATKVAQEVTGVKQVVNNVAIAPSTSMGTKLDDSLITGKVKAALMDAADVKSLQINVETRGGVTQLAGYVSSEAMKARAGQIAAGIDGVKSVDNVLVVKPR
jgi:hyperosmotically inducible periplasmic protein